MAMPARNNNIVTREERKGNPVPGDSDRSGMTIRNIDPYAGLLSTVMVPPRS